MTTTSTQRASTANRRPSFSAETQSGIYDPANRLSLPRASLGSSSLRKVDDSSVGAIFNTGNEARDIEDRFHEVLQKDYDVKRQDLVKQHIRSAPSDIVRPLRRLSRIITGEVLPGEEAETVNVLVSLGLKLPSPDEILSLNTPTSVSAAPFSWSPEKFCNLAPLDVSLSLSSERSSPSSRCDSGFYNGSEESPGSFSLNHSQRFYSSSSGSSNYYSSSYSPAATYGNSTDNLGGGRSSFGPNATPSPSQSELSSPSFNSGGSAAVQLESGRRRERRRSTGMLLLQPINEEGRLADALEQFRQWDSVQMERRFDKIQQRRDEIVERDVKEMLKEDDRNAWEEWRARSQDETERYLMEEEKAREEDEDEEEQATYKEEEVERRAKKEEGRDDAVSAVVTTSLKQQQGGVGCKNDGKQGGKIKTNNKSRSSSSSSRSVPSFAVRRASITITTTTSTTTIVTPFLPSSTAVRRRSSTEILPTELFGRGRRPSTSLPTTSSTVIRSNPSSSSKSGGGTQLPAVTAARNPCRT